jgi:hypothetical protein
MNSLLEWDYSYKYLNNSGKSQTCRMILIINMYFRSDNMVIALSSKKIAVATNCPGCKAIPYDADKYLP